MTKESKHAEHRFWTCSPQQTCVQLGCTMDGLTATEASERLDRYGPNSDAPAKAIGPCAPRFGACSSRFRSFCLSLASFPL